MSYIYMSDLGAARAPKTSIPVGNGGATRPPKTAAGGDALERGMTIFEKGADFAARTGLIPGGAEPPPADLPPDAYAPPPPSGITGTHILGGIALVGGLWFVATRWPKK